MKISASFIIALTVQFVGFGQSNFSKGYFVTNNNERIACYINNLDWKYNPTLIEYKISQDQEIQKTLTSDILEFSISGVSKYIRADVQIDRSSNKADKLSKTRGPSWSEEKLFLKVILEGPTSLYLFEESNLVKFFYRDESGEIEQLIYKRFLVGSIHVNYNRDYHQQLFRKINCNQKELREIQKIEYELKDLMQYIAKDNLCRGIQSITYGNPAKKGTFHLSVRPGLDFSSLSTDLSNPGSTRGVDFGNKMQIRFGLELEYILNFSAGRWSLLIEPTYQSFSAETERITGSWVKSTESVKINYQSIDLPIGVRYNYHINKYMKIYANAHFVSSFSFNMDSSIDYENTSNLVIEPKSNLAIGLGAMYKKLSVETRFYTNRDIMNKYPAWNSDFSKTSLIIGYRIF